MILILSLWTGGLEVSAWWWRRSQPVAEQGAEAASPASVMSPGEELRREAAGWLGAMATENPARRVRAVHVPGGRLSDSGPSWGVGFGRLANDVRTAFLMFAPAPGGNPAERRIVVASAEKYPTVVGEAGASPEVCEALLQSDGGLFVKGRLNHAAEQRLAEVAALLLLKLHTVELVPLFLNAGTPVAETVTALQPFLADPQAILIAFWPDAADREDDSDWQDALARMTDEAAGPGDLAGLPLSTQVAVGLAGVLDWGTLAVRVADRTALSGAALLHLEPAVNLELMARAARLEWDDQATRNAFLDAKQAVTRENYRGEVVNPAEKLLLLDLARRVIISQLDGQEPPPLPVYSSNLMQKYGCQVALRQGDDLLGQYLIMPGQEPLAKAVVMNAARFLKADGERSAVTSQAMAEARVEISVLSQPEAVFFASPEELYGRLRPGRHGVLLAAGGKQAGFLPVVWKQVPEAENFMAALCRRVGQSPEVLSRPDTKVEVFEMVTFYE
ncbi:MAG: AMMECR1 domain-containing protein [Lentisphaeria bacterium]|nr:AMMECR1 domain-containing protein [Lentisphaeria bacterium]